MKEPKNCALFRLTPRAILYYNCNEERQKRFAFIKKRQENKMTIEEQDKIIEIVKSCFK